MAAEFYYHARNVMVGTTPSEAHRHEEFSLPLFLLTVALTLAGLLALLPTIAPALWELQFLASGWAFAAAFVAISLLLCFLEYFFHRYVLHRPAIPGLGRLYRQHTLHHALTRVARRPAHDGRSLLVVENKFPILEAEQGEASFFPWYALATFALLLTPLLALLQWTAPSFPWFFAGYASLATSLTLYELLHAISHWPIERWSPLLQHRTWGAFWRRVYCFHLRHHAVIDCNESVSGFFGLPLADWVFGTCVIPRTIYADGEEWKRENFTPPRPCRLIEWLDRRASLRVRRSRNGKRQQKTAGHFTEREDTRAEEIANWLTHGMGAVLSTLALTLLIYVASERGDAWHVVSFTVFGLSLLLLYTISTLYHLSRSERRRWLFRRLDHAAIFILIAGTYTPFLLTNLRGPWGWSLFGVVWGLCGAGAVFKFFTAGRYRFTSTLSYLFVGWLIVVAIEPLLTAVPRRALWLLFAGGVVYTAGVPFYLWERLRYHHAIWHGFVLVGSLCHFLAVLFCLAPRA